jgi:alcohol dehydrogenase
MDVSGYYEFCSRVRIISGHGALEQIPDTLTDLGARIPLIITDRGVSEAGLLGVVTDAIMEHVTIGGVADDVPQDSDVRIVNRLAEIYRQKNCDSIIAIGGGSVMDTAKGVNIVVSENADDLMKFSGAGALKRALKPLIAVPTTAGTGSEVTLVAVVKDHERHLKMTFVSYFLVPDAAILDSRMTITLPPFMTAATAMDAMAHAVEAYTGLAKNPLSDSCALAAIRLISHNLLKVMNTPGDKEGRLALANGATMAGMAFSNSMVGIVHTLGHAAGSVCGVPHGTAMTILLPYGLEYNMHKNGHLTAELLLALAGDDVYARTPAHLRPERVIEYIRGMNQELHDLSGGRHARFFKEVVSRAGSSMVPHDMLGNIATAALQDGAIFWNPEDADYDDFMMLLEAAWEGVPLDRTRIRKG